MSHHDIGDRLTRRDGAGPFFHVLATSPSDAYDLAWKLNERAVARVVRGSRCRTWHALFDEFAAAWQFPPYFGGNVPALHECLGDLEWLPSASYVVAITEAVQLLDSESTDDLHSFIELIVAVAKYWPDSHAPGRTPDSAPASFHVVLQAEPAEVAALDDRLTKAGAAYHLLSEPR